MTSTDRWHTERNQATPPPKLCHVCLSTDGWYYTHPRHPTAPANADHSDIYHTLAPCPRCRPLQHELADLGAYDADRYFEGGKDERFESVRARYSTDGRKRL